MTDRILTADQLQEFNREGILLLRGFYDFTRDIFPILKSIYAIIGLIAHRHNVSLEREPFDPDHFDSGYDQLIAYDRSFGGEVYDAVKQITAFVRLISLEKNEALFAELRQSDVSGVGGGSYGIRIDNPNEDQFRSQWHQEFLFQPQSIDGVVFWTPLATVTQDMGPVIACLKSHHDGLCKYSKSSPYAAKSGAYKIGILNEEQVAAGYEHSAPLTLPGDLLVMDFLTIHQSGINVSNRSRWSVQSRLFNFKDPVGLKIGWKASVTTGTDIESIFPDNFS